MKIRTASLLVFVFGSLVLGGCGSKIDGRLVLQPVWPCEIRAEAVAADVGNWCLTLVRTNGSEAGRNCSASLDDLSVAADEESGQVRLKLEAWDKFNIQYARGLSVPLRLVSGEDNTVPVAMALVGRFSLIAGRASGCSPLPFHLLVPSALALPSGHVLAAGCLDPDNLDDTGRCALLVDPTNYRITTLSTPDSLRRYAHRLAALADGRVLVVGGLDVENKPVASLAVLRGGDVFLQPYQPGLDYSLARFEQLPLGLKTARTFSTVVTVFFGTQVLVNDNSGNTPEMWLANSESSDYISVSGADPFPFKSTLKYAQGVAALDESRAAVLGGVDNHQGLLAVEKNSRQVFFNAFSLPFEARNAPQALDLGNGDVLFVGGKENSVSTTSPVIVLNVNNRTITEIAPASNGFPRGGFTLTRLPDGRVLVAGGFNNTPDFRPGATFLIGRTGDAINPWKMETGPDLKMPRLFHTSALLPDGRVVLLGGGSSNHPTVEHKRVMVSAEVVTF